MNPQFSITDDLSEKIKREREFHNEWAKSIRVEDLFVRESFEALTAIENQYVLKELGDLHGKKILDLGCGAGESSVYLALCGARVSACDIAEDFLALGRSLAGKFGVAVDFAQADTARLPYADETFDLVYGNGILHHVELAPTIQEIRRVLKKGGKAAFIEPLPYNPIINVYRWMARGVRTDDEKPLTFAQFRTLQEYFSEVRHEEFWLLSLVIFFHFFFVRRWHPSKVRYWKKVIEAADDYKTLFPKWQKIDHSLLRLLPFLRRLCWNSVLIGIK